MKEWKWRNWHQNRIVKVFLVVDANLFVKKARLAILRPNMFNIELFKKYDVTLQNQPTHPYSLFVRKSKTPTPTAWRIVWMAPLCYAILDHYFLTTTEHSFLGWEWRKEGENSKISQNHERAMKLVWKNTFANFPTNFIDFACALVNTQDNQYYSAFIKPAVPVWCAVGAWFDFKSLASLDLASPINWLNYTISFS